MKKKTLVLLMACILALSMTAVVYAAGSSKTTISALYREPEIKVNVPTMGELYLNPMRLPLTIDGHVEDAQIINTPWSIENQSECAVRVNAEVYADINSRSDMLLSTRSLAGSRTRGKRAFIYLDMRVTDPGVDLTTLNWNQTVYDGKKQILVTETGRERSNIMTLAGPAGDGRVSPGSVGAFRLSGDATENPSEEWNSAVDTIAVHITFTFRPVADPAA